MEELEITLEIEDNSEIPIELEQENIEIIYEMDLQEKEVTPTREKQVITQDEEYDGLSKVTVKPIPVEYIIPEGNLQITENGVYIVREKESVNVNVEYELKLQDKQVNPTKELQEVLADDEFDGLGKVSVNPIPSDYIKPTGIIDISSNGEYDVKNYEVAKVETSGSDINEYFDIEEIISSGSNRVYNWANCVKKLPPLECTTGTSLTYAFYGFNGESLDLSRFDTTNINNMSYLFCACRQLITLDLKSFNTERVTTMMQMFYNCLVLETLDISSFKTPALTTMQQMFYNCKKLKSLDFSGFNTEKVTTMANTFYYCNELTSLDLSTFKTPVLTNTTNMFAYCTKLTYIDMRNFDFTNVTSYSQMFGTNSTTSVPNSCLIIVKDDTAKEWITSKFTRLTNVKTVAEYETQ